MKDTEQIGTLIQYRRRVQLLGSDAFRGIWALNGKRMRFYTTSAKGLVVDDSPLSVGNLVNTKRLCLSVVLSGELLCYAPEGVRYYRPGDWFLEQGAHPERWMGPFRALCADWESEHHQVPCSGSLSMVERLQMERFARRIEEGVKPEDRNALVTSFARSFSLDLPFGPEPWSRSDQHLLDALGTMMSSLHSQPMWVDLESCIPRCERQLRRRFLDLLKWLPAELRSLRRYLLMQRLRHAASFLTVPQADLAAVAASVGYGSARAFCNTLRKKNLPTPKELGKAVKQGLRL